MICFHTGNPYRHEILQSAIKNRGKALVWCGEHGFYDVGNVLQHIIGEVVKKWPSVNAFFQHPKPLKGETQVFYPTPPKAVLPNPKLRDWGLTLSERVSNMLKNLERAHWVTSYQMHFTGNGGCMTAHMLGCVPSSRNGPEIISESSDSEYFINPFREIFICYSCPLKYESRVQKYLRT